MSTKNQNDRICGGVAASDFNAEYFSNALNCASSEDDARWKEENTHVCSITGETYVGYGNNAYPFPGRCSDDANRKYVIPARLLNVSPEMVSKWGVSAIAQTVATKAQKLGWKF